MCIRVPVAGVVIFLEGMLKSYINYVIQLPELYFSDKYRLTISQRNFQNSIRVIA